MACVFKIHNIVDGCRKLDIYQIVADNDFQFGSYNDGYVLQYDVFEDGSCVIFNPAAMGRGIGFNISKLASDGEVALVINLPTSKSEIEDFFRLAKYLIEKCGSSKLSIDSQPVVEADFASRMKDILDFSLTELRERMDTTKNGGVYMITTANYPYAFSTAMRERFMQATSLDEFENFIHNVQCKDVYYAKPNLFENKDGIIAVYTLTEECVSVFPTDGANSLVKLTFGVDIDYAMVRFYIMSEDRVIPHNFDYQDFMKIITDRYDEYFDFEHIIIPSLDKEELTEIAKMLGL